MRTPILYKAHDGDGASLFFRRDDTHATLASYGHALKAGEPKIVVQHFEQDALVLDTLTLGWKPHAVSGELLIALIQNPPPVEEK